MAEEQQTQATQADAKEQTQAAASAETKNADTESQELMIPKHRYDEVSRKLKALEEDASKRAQAQAEADEKRLAEQQEWQKLYESRKADVEKLTPKAQLADKLSALVLEQYAAEIAAWPEPVKAMAPAEDADVLTKLDWMRRAKPLAEELSGDKQPAAGNGRRPKPSGPVKTERKIEPIYDVRRNF